MTAVTDAVSIRVCEITRVFGQKSAVKEVDLTINSGESFGLLGSNGAGKSTLIKMLTTLLPPTSGTAEVGGFDIRKAPTDVRRHIG